MALFTDGPTSSIEDLRGHDTQLLEIASVEGIDVTKKLLLAQEEIAIEVAALLRRMSSRAGTGNVVVTPALKLWHTFKALELVYQDAYHSQLNDRYASRRDEYREMAQWAQDKVMQGGLGMTADPVPQAGAPGVVTAPGALAAGTYYVGMSWINASGEEGACSLPTKITVAGSSFVVSHGVALANATGWNVYVGSAPQSLLRQNGAVLVVGTAWTQPDSVANGKPAGTGQAASYWQQVPQLIERG